MPTRRERLDARLAEAEAAVRATAQRLVQASAERLRRARGARSLRERLAALEDPLLTRSDRRILRESVGVPLAPERGPQDRRGLRDRLRIALARRPFNPIDLALSGIVAASLLGLAGLAWLHTGRGARIGGRCPQELTLSAPDGRVRPITLRRDDFVVVRGAAGAEVRIAVWVPGYGDVTGTVPAACVTRAP